jgi:ribosomal protein S18 acetylase RimI-like enzyme
MACVAFVRRSPHEEACMVSDDASWIEAGGDRDRLELYRRIADVAVFSDGDGRCMAAVHPDRPHVGALGDWVGSQDVLRRGESWLVEKGCSAARGPMEVCRWFLFRGTLGPYDDAPFSLETTRPAQPWLDAGYEVIGRWASVVPEPDRMIRMATDRAGSLAAQGWSVAQLPAGGDGRVALAELRPAADQLLAVFRGSFGSLEGYPDLPIDVLMAYHARHGAEVDPRLSFMARDPEGRIVGLVLCNADKIDEERGWFVILSLAVLPEHQHRGLGSWLAAVAHRAGQRLGLRGVHALVALPDNRSAGPFFNGRLVRNYVLTERTLV